MDDFEIDDGSRFDEDLSQNNYFYVGSTIADFQDDFQIEKKWTEDGILSDDLQKSSEGQKNGELKVKVFHKTRGGKGRWNTIGTMELIRVTKGIGKRLRLEITSDLLVKESFDWDGLGIRLFEIHESSELDLKDFVMDTQELSEDDNKLILNVELKIHHLCKNLQFYISYKCPTGTLSLTGQSSQFSTHDSGKRRKKLPSINIDINKIEPLEINVKQEPDNVVVESLTSTTSSYSPISSPSRSTSLEEVSEDSNLDYLFLNENSHESLSDEGCFNITANDDSISCTKKRKLDELTLQEVENNTIYFDKSLEVNGIVRATNFFQYSDIRFKTNIEEITDALNIISNLHGKRYQWKSNTKIDESLSGGKKVIGLIAQEVKKIVPEAVLEDGDGYLSVNYTDMVPLLIEALKQHVRNCENDNVKIKEEINDLRSKIDDLSLNLNSTNLGVSNESESIYSYVIEKIRQFCLNVEDATKPAAITPKPNTDDQFIIDERTPFTVSSINFPTQPVSTSPPTDTVVPKEKGRSFQPAPIRMIKCIVDLARSTIPSPTPKETVIKHSIFRNLDVKASLITPGYSRTPLTQLKTAHNVSKAVVISISGWLLWCKSNEQGLSRYVSDSERESLQICHRAASLLEETFPNIDVEYFGMELRGDTQTGVEDLCYEIFKQVSGSSGETTSLRQKIEEADLIWFIGHTQGVVPCVLVCDRLIKSGILNSDKQMINILSLGGVHQPSTSPLSSVHPNPLICKDLHTFPQNKDFNDYKEALSTILEKQVHITMVSAYNDSLVRLPSSNADYIHHPNLLRSLFVNKEYKSLFEPQHTFKKANNLSQEMILLSLEMKNKYQYDVDSLQLGNQHDFDFDSWVKNANDMSLTNLQTMLYDQETEMPKTFVNLLYELKTSSNMFSTWGYKFHKTTKFLKEGIERHYQIPYLNDTYTLALEHLLKSWKPNASPIQSSMRESNEAFYMSLPKQIQSVKKVYSYDTSKLESSFKYWKPSLQKEILVQSLIHESLGWPVRQSFFEEYVDGLANLVSQEKESPSDQLAELPTPQSTV